MKKGSARRARGPQGIPGPRSRRGPRGATDVNKVDIEKIYRTLDIQLGRMAQIQKELDELRELIKKLK
jgi:hypothetical protein